jgi:hypothetical protein
MKTLWLLIVLLMVFMCPHPCSEVFDKEVGLSVHQNSCQYVNEHNTNLDRAVAARKERKRLKKELKAAAAAAAQPTLESMHDVPQVFVFPAKKVDLTSRARNSRHRAHTRTLTCPTKSLNTSPNHRTKNLSRQNLLLPGVPYERNA